MDRRAFVMTAGAAIPSLIFTQQTWADNGKPPAIDDDLVGKFVGKSHFDFDTVRAMLKDHPQLVNCCWDWGGGDYETGLGAAAHTGGEKIANLLLNHGARLDLFVATMLGMKGVVHAAFEALPEIHKTRGPHGIPLLSHAVVGGAKSFELVEYLVKQGAEVNAQANNGMSPLIVAASIDHIDAVKLLLEKGADKTAKDAKGQSAKDWAASRGYDRVVSLLEGKEVAE
ncbi:MAG: ankyrin repeat domain-containing protein [Phycisphaerales bacterium]|nr:ankyrin repeat domain-containing protein [Phycisphaerales bacterium]